MPRTMPDHAQVLDYLLETINNGLERRDRTAHTAMTLVGKALKTWDDADEKRSAQRVASEVHEALEALADDNAEDTRAYKVLETMSAVLLDIIY